MTTPIKSSPAYLMAVRSWIIGLQVSVYLRGRPKPMTGLTVCAVYPSVMVARANSSTHLIPALQIVTIRFTPDSEPGRNPDHPLHTIVAQKGTQPIPGNRETAGGPRNYPQDDPGAVRQAKLDDPHYRPRHSPRR